jgi:hypothetical protein
MQTEHQPKSHFDEKEKLKILLHENENIRKELGLYVKIVNNFIFAFLATLGAGIGVFINLNGKELNTNFSYTGLLSFVLSQVVVIILVYSNVLNLSVAARSAYLAHLENKINQLAGERLVFWENKIVSYALIGGVSMFNRVLLYFFYLAFFLVLVVYGYDKIDNHIYTWIQGAEMIILTFSFLKLVKEKDKVHRYILRLEKEKMS